MRKIPIPKIKIAKLFKFISAPIKKLLLFVPKSVVCIAAVVIVAAILIGLGAGLGPGKGSSNSPGEDTPSESAEPIAVTEPVPTQTEEPTEPEMLVLTVTVMGNDYFYENARISLDDLIQEFSSFEVSFVVEVTDDNASKMAYDALIDRLDNAYIDYEVWT